MGKAKKETERRVITPEEKKKYQDRVINAVNAARAAKSAKAYDGAVRKLCDIAKELEYKNLWVYFQLTGKENWDKVDERAVEAIARVCGLKPGWAHFAKKEIEKLIKQSLEADKKKILDKITDEMVEREDFEEAGIFFDKLDPETHKEAAIRWGQNVMKALDKLKADYEEYKKENPEFRIEFLEG